MADAALVNAMERRKLKCPRCGRVSWVDRDAGGVGARCPSCGGVHLSAVDVDQLICHELGLTTSELRAKASGPSDKDLGACPSCTGALSAVEVDDVKVELCLRCGAGWLDPGELERLTHGRHLERAPPDAIARVHLPRAVSRGRRRGRISIPSHNLLHDLFGWTALAGGFAGSFFFVGLPIMGAGLYVLLRRRVVVDFDRDTLRVKNGALAGGKVRLSDVGAIAVEAAGHIVNGYPTVKWAVVIKGERIESQTLLAYTNRKIAHRVAFQLSQLLEVPVLAPRASESEIQSA